MNAPAIIQSPLRKACCLIISAIFVICLAQTNALHAAEYQIATTQNPFHVKDTAIKVMTRAYNSLGHSLTIHEYPQGRSLLVSNSGHVDAELFRAAGVSEEHKNLIQISEPIACAQILAYIRKDSGLAPTKWRDLKHLIVGYTNGAKIVEQNLRGNYTLTVKHPEQLFEMLKNGRIDVAIYSATNEPIPGDVVAIGTPLLEIPVYHYIHQKNKNLIEPLEQSIRRLTEGCICPCRP